MGWLQKIINALIVAACALCGAYVGFSLACDIIWLFLLKPTPTVQMVLYGTDEPDLSGAGACLQACDQPVYFLQSNNGVLSSAQTASVKDSN